MFRHPELGHGKVFQNDIVFAVAPPGQTFDRRCPMIGSSEMLAVVGVFDEPVCPAVDRRQQIIAFECAHILNRIAPALDF